MSKVKKTDAIERASQAVEFTLQFRPTQPGIGRATLTSPLLDPLLHGKDSTVAIFSGIAGEAAGDNAGEFAIGSFQMESLYDYLTQQPTLRIELEQALDNHLEQWDSKKKLPRGNKIWSKAKVAALVLSPRSVANPAGVKSLLPHLTPAQLKKFAASSGAAATRSSFSIEIEAPWPDEHQRIADFRDCKLVELRADG